MTMRACQAAAVTMLWLTCILAADTQSAEPSEQPGVTALTVAVREMLAEPVTAYPAPWKPRRERPREFVVVPGEKLSYAERLTAMGLAGLANRAGPRLFVRGHFGFNADADRFWVSRLAHEYVISHREISLDDALAEFRGSIRGAVICDEQLSATEAVALTLAGALRLLPALPSMQPRLEAAGIHVVLDLRGRWQDHVAAQQWVFDVVGPRLSDQLIGFLDVRNKALWGVADYRSCGAPRSPGADGIAAWSKLLIVLCFSVHEQRVRLRTAGVRRRLAISTSCM
jgi:hypothetical protein